VGTRGVHEVAYDLLEEIKTTASHENRNVLEILTAYSKVIKFKTGN